MFSQRHLQTSATALSLPAMLIGSVIRRWTRFRVAVRSRAGSHKPLAKEKVAGSNPVCCSRRKNGTEPSENQPLSCVHWETRKARPFSRALRILCHPRKKNVQAGIVLNLLRIDGRATCIIGRVAGVHCEQVVPKVSDDVVKTAPPFSRLCWADTWDARAEAPSEVVS